MAGQGHWILIDKDWRYLELCTIQVNTTKEWAKTKTDTPGFLVESQWIMWHALSKDKEDKLQPHTLQG